jgi:hypothetical protein
VCNIWEFHLCTMCCKLLTSLICVRTAVAAKRLVCNVSVIVKHFSYGPSIILCTGLIGAPLASLRPCVQFSSHTVRVWCELASPSTELCGECTAAFTAPCSCVWCRSNLFIQAQVVTSQSKTGFFKRTHNSNDHRITHIEPHILKHVVIQPRNPAHHHSPRISLNGTRLEYRITTCTCTP